MTRAPVVALLLAAGAISLTACTDEGTTGSGALAAGPLAAPVAPGEGGLSIMPPDDGPTAWTGTFSALPLCAEEPGKLRVTKVTALDSWGTVRDVEAFVATPGQESPTSVVLSAEGSPPTFSEEYARGNLAMFEGRTFHAPGDAVDIETCAGASLETQPHLAIVFTTDATGGGIREWTLDYTLDGRKYRVPAMEYEMVLCGNDAPGEVC